MEDDDEFGQGLLGESPRTPAPSRYEAPAAKRYEPESESEFEFEENIADEGPDEESGSDEAGSASKSTEDEAGQGAERKRRRRRRRRSRSPEGRPGTPPGQPAAEGTAPREEAPRRDAVRAESDDEDSDDEVEGAEDVDLETPATAETAEEAAARPRRRRSRRRRRGGSSDQPRLAGEKAEGEADAPGGREAEPRKPEPARQERLDFSDDEEEDEDSADVDVENLDSDDDDSAEFAVTYTNVPTWEEAISYLLRPSQVQVDPNSAPPPPPKRNGPPGDTPRAPSRHYGNRRKS